MGPCFQPVTCQEISAGSRIAIEFVLGQTAENFFLGLAQLFGCRLEFYNELLQSLPLLLLVAEVNHYKSIGEVAHSRLFVVLSTHAPPFDTANLCLCSVQECLVCRNNGPGPGGLDFQSSSSRIVFPSIFLCHPPRWPNVQNHQQMDCTQLTPPPFIRLIWLKISSELNVKSSVLTPCSVLRVVHDFWRHTSASVLHFVARSHA